ncbi:uncharacterized protein LOC126298143 [Schistocerca gregaria]|uniref:uncharacterized protein LOC126298143 n=1 Tax=Schistocerca gregaria TaxID=7010 RepID=UPI00211EB506|nr:uncharacterized protein LOC126298143 [Schistocerca gregaria]
MNFEFYGFQLTCMIRRRTRAEEGPRGSHARRRRRRRCPWLPWVTACARVRAAALAPPRRRTCPCRRPPPAATARRHHRRPSSARHQITAVSLVFTFDADNPQRIYTEGITVSTTRTVRMVSALSGLAPRGPPGNQLEGAEENNGGRSRHASLPAAVATSPANRKIVTFFHAGISPRVEPARTRSIFTSQ